MNPTALPARRVVVIVVDGLQDGVEVVKNNFDAIFPIVPGEPRKRVCPEAQRFVKNIDPSLSLFAATAFTMNCSGKAQVRWRGCPEAQRFVKNIDPRLSLFAVTSFTMNCSGESASPPVPACTLPA